MECGVDDTLCQILGLVFQENEFATGLLTEWLGKTGILGRVSDFLRDHGQTLVALAGFSFGLYRWWKYREAMLHRRLEEYLNENDRRLVSGQNAVLEALRRPGPGQEHKAPLFAETPLVSVLREQNWDRTALAANVFTSADWQLSLAMSSITKKISAAERTISSLRQQMTTAQIIRGAVASAQSSRPRTSRNFGVLALTSFRAALSVPGHSQNLIAKELEAHQLRKLGLTNEAMIAYEELEQLASGLNEEKPRALVTARAKLYQAVIKQVQACQPLSDGSRSFNFSLSAYGLLSSDDDSVIRLRSKFGPFERWDLIEQAEIHYLTALVANIRNSWNAVEAAQLDAAESGYRQILAQRYSFASGRKATDRTLKNAARAGLVRIEKARGGTYDYAWLGC